MDVTPISVSHSFDPGDGYGIANYTKGGQNATINFTLVMATWTENENISNITEITFELPSNVIFSDLGNVSNGTSLNESVGNDWWCESKNAGLDYYLNWSCYNATESQLSPNDEIYVWFNFTANNTGTEEAIVWSITIVGNSSAQDANTTYYSTNLDAQAPRITLDSPADFYNETATGNVTFNYTATDANLDTCELWGNWTTSWHLNETFLGLTSGATNGSSNITIEDGLYVWSVYCNDTLGNSNTTVDNYTLTVDLTAPNITLDSPADFYNETVNNSVTFNYTASDIVSDVDTCELWGNWSGGWHLNETFVSPPEDVTNGSSNITIEDGLYVWSVYCNDSLGTSNTTVQNYTLAVDLTVPVVTLDSPSDNSYDTDGDVNFSFTAVETYPDRCTLYFRSNETNWAANDSTSYSNNIQANIFVNLTDAVYVWNVECDSIGSNPAFASANRTLTVDTTMPVTPTVTEPSDIDIHPRDSISYTCESSDATAGINSWAWTLTKPDSTTVAKIGGAVTSNSQSFSGDETNLAGTYAVKCEVEDKAGYKSSSSKNFEVHYTTVVAGEGEGGGAAADINLATEEEITITEKQGVISTFTLDGVTIHTLKIKKVDEVAGTVTIIIESDPIEITLKIGETKEVDVDADGTNDISITLNKITKGIADITTKRLTPLPEKEVPTEEVPPTEKPAEEITPTSEAASKAWLWILIIVIIVVIGVGYVVLNKKGKNMILSEEKTSPSVEIKHHKKK
ncbi:MAG: hypothetical protein Q8O03_04080 [Nanoarchaeota archaeon]|nr:hypothetical protein [Nanoarchaeota archaeon]